MLVFAAALFQAAQGATRQPITFDQVRSLPPKVAAQSFLPAQAAAQIVVTSEARRDGMLPGGVWLTFSTEARSAGRHLCRREQYSFLASERRDGTLVAATDPIQPNPALKLADACSGLLDAQFASVQPGSDVNGAIEILQWLSQIRDAARGRGALAVTLSCKSKAKPSKCIRGVRRAFASLPLEKTFAIGLDDDRPGRWELLVTETKPGDVLWTVKVDRTRAVPTIQLLWHYPAPF